MKREEGKPQKTRKATAMKKASLQSLDNFLNGETVTNLDEIKAEIVAELAKGAEKAQANHDLYAQAHDIVMNGLRMATAPVTIGELYESIANELPDGFSKGKVQYAITRLWADEVVKTEGKVNSYSVKE